MNTYELVAKSYSRRPWSIVFSVVNENTLLAGDIGSGPGHNMVAILEKYPRLRGVILDYSYNMVYQGYRASVRKGLCCRLLAIQCDMRTLPFRNQVFDTLLYIASIHHIPCRRWRRTVLQEAYRVLKTGGVLLVTVWARYQLYFLPQLVRNITSRLKGLKESIGDIVKPWRHGESILFRYYHLYSLKELVDDIMDSGFKIVDKGVYYPRKSFLKPYKNYYVIGLK